MRLFSSLVSRSRMMLEESLGLFARGKSLELGAGETGDQWLTLVPCWENSRLEAFCDGVKVLFRLFRPFGAHGVLKRI